MVAHSKPCGLESGAAVYTYIYIYVNHYNNHGYNMYNIIIVRYIIIIIIHNYVFLILNWYNNIVYV